MSEFREKFEHLNNELRSALVIGDFEAVCIVDAERRALLSDFMSVPSKADDELLAYIESCAVENAQISADLDEALTSLSHQFSKSQKMMRAYSR